MSKWWTVSLMKVFLFCFVSFFKPVWNHFFPFFIILLFWVVWSPEMFWCWFNHVKHFITFCSVKNQVYNDDDDQYVNYKKAWMRGALVAYLIERASNVQRLCPGCSGYRFDSILWLPELSWNLNVMTVVGSFAYVIITVSWMWADHNHTARIKQMTWGFQY